MVRLTGITWDHRRAVEPLEALDAALRTEHPEIEVSWQARPLSGFEFDPIERLAADYDMVIFDHPFCGRIAETGCLMPVTDLVEAAGGDAAYAGPSVASYRYRGSVWGVPVDAACQVAAYRPDLMARLGARVPENWQEVLELARRAAGDGMSVAIGLRGVHSLMTLFSLCANLGGPLAGDAAGSWNDAAASRALQLMRELVAACGAPVLDWNSIETQEMLSTRDDLVYCPAVYGFAAYGEADRRGRLAFGPFPGPKGNSTGSTIGGAALGLSARLDPARREAALAYARLASKSAIQTGIFASQHGQPAHIGAWRDDTIDKRFNAFFSTTRTTIESCWIRPRYDGYLAFQARAGALVEAHLRGKLGEDEVLRDLASLDRECRDGPSG